MKIEIDLNDILGDDYCSETMQESIRRQVVESLTATIKEGIGKRIDRGIAQALDEEIKKSISEKMPSIIDDILKAEYVQVDKYGHSTGKPTNFRAELVNNIAQQMVYKTGGYSSDKNPFTNAVDGLIDKNMKLFQTEFNKLVDAGFCKDAMEYATKKLSERLGIKAA